MNEPAACSLSRDATRPFFSRPLARARTELGPPIRCCVMEIAKALILAGNGSDDCTWPVVSGSRHLFPVANRPILFHNLEALRTAGILEATILAEPEAGEAIERAVGDGSDWDLTVRHAAWRSSDGLLGALGGRTRLPRRRAGARRARRRAPARAHARARVGLRARATRRARAAPGADRAGGAGAHPGLSVQLTRGLDAARERRRTASNPVAGLRAGGGRVRVQNVDGCLPCHGNLEALIESNRCMLERHASHVDPASPRRQHRPRRGRDPPHRQDQPQPPARPGDRRARRDG